MKTICKLAEAECPNGLLICCGTCERKTTCDMVCGDVAGWQTCDDAREITDELTQFQSAVPEAIQKITNLVLMKKHLEDQEKLLKEELVKAMEAYGVKSFENEQIKMTYVAPTTRSTIDSARLKKDHPDIAQVYSKTSNVSASVRITVK